MSVCSCSLHKFVLVLIFINERNQVVMRDTCNIIRWSDEKNNMHATRWWRWLGPLAQSMRWAALTTQSFPICTIFMPANCMRICALCNWKLRQFHAQSILCTYGIKALQTAAYATMWFDTLHIQPSAIRWRHKTRNSIRFSIRWHTKDIYYSCYVTSCEECWLSGNRKEHSPGKM